MIGRCLRDTQVWAALLVALLLWIGLAYWIPVADPRPWIAAHPLRFLMLVVAFPLAEELAFRGALQTWLLRRPAFAVRHLHLSTANLVTSLAFSTLHVFTRSFGVGAQVLIPSLVLGHLRERPGGVPAAVAVHMVWNAGFFLLWPPGSFRVP